MESYCSAVLAKERREVHADHSVGKSLRLYNVRLLYNGKLFYLESYCSAVLAKERREVHADHSVGKSLRQYNVRLLFNGKLFLFEKHKKPFEKEGLIVCAVDCGCSAVRLHFVISQKRS